MKFNRIPVLSLEMEGTKKETRKEQGPKRKKQREKRKKEKTGVQEGCPLSTAINNLPKERNKKW